MLYFIHVICLFILPTETVWSMYGIIMFDINMYDLSDLPKKLPIVIGESEWCLMAHKIINSPPNIILSIFFHPALGDH